MRDHDMREMRDHDMREMQSREMREIFTCRVCERTGVYPEAFAQS